MKSSDYLPRIELPSSGESDGEPPPLRGHRLAIVDDYAYIYGGLYSDDDKDSRAASTFVWRFCLRDNTWKKISQLQDEIYHVTPTSSALAVTKKWGILTYGGTGLPFGNALGSELCQLTIPDGLNYKICPLDWSGDPPPGCYGAVLIPDEANDFVYLMGGTDGRQYYSHVYRGEILINCNTSADEIVEVLWECISDPSKLVLGRYRHEGVLYDNQLLFFGGSNSKTLHSVSQITAFDLNTNQYRLISSIPDHEHGAPPDRDFFSLVRHGQNVIILGGRAHIEDTNLLDDIWVLNLETFAWTKHHAKLYFPVAFNAADVDSNGRIYVFGGRDEFGNRSKLMQSFLASTIPLQIILEKVPRIELPHPEVPKDKLPENLPRIELPHPDELDGEPTCDCCPPPLSNHRLAIVDDFAYVFGGVYRDYDEDLQVSTFIWRFCLRDSTWKKLPRLQDEIYHITPISSALAVTKKWGILTYGGTGIPFDFANGSHLCQLTFPKSLWYKIWPFEFSGDSPPGCSGAVLIPDEANDCVYLMGGTDADGYYSQVYKGDISITCDTSADSTANEEFHVKWQCISDPSKLVSGRYRHEGVLYDNQLLFFGGSNSDTLHSVSQITAFDLKTNEFHIIPSNPDPEHGAPPDRDCFSLVRHGKNVYVIGGGASADEELLLDDIWVLNLETLAWTKHHVDLHFRTAFNAADVDSNGRIYVFGGWRSNAGSIGRSNLMQSFLA